VQSESHGVVVVDDRDADHRRLGSGEAGKCLVERVPPVLRRGTAGGL
jgi:hypothetical protein